MDPVYRLSVLFSPQDDHLFRHDPAQGTDPARLFDAPAPGLRRALVFPVPLGVLGPQARTGIVHVLAHLDGGDVVQWAVPATRFAGSADFWRPILETQATVRPSSFSVQPWLGAFLRSARWSAYADAVGAWLDGQQWPGLHIGLRSRLRAHVEASLHRRLAAFNAAIAADGGDDDPDPAALRALAGHHRLSADLTERLLRQAQDPAARHFLSRSLVTMPAPLLRMAEQDVAAPGQALHRALCGHGSVVDALLAAGFARPVVRRILKSPHEIPSGWTSQAFARVARHAGALEPNALPCTMAGWMVLRACVGAVDALAGNEALGRQHLRWIYAAGPAMALSRLAALKGLAAGLRRGEYTPPIRLRRDITAAILTAASHCAQSGSGPQALGRRLHVDWVRLRQQAARQAACLIVGKADVPALVAWVAGAAPGWCSPAPSSHGLRLRLIDGEGIWAHGKACRNCLAGADPYWAMRFLARREMLFSLESSTGGLLGTVAIRLPAHGRAPGPALTAMSGVENAPLVPEVTHQVRQLFGDFVVAYEHRAWVPVLRRSRRLAMVFGRAVNDALRNRYPAR